MNSQQRVIWSVTPDQSQSPYIISTVNALRDRQWTVDSLSLRDLLTSKGQLVHIQWPEHVSRGPKLAKTWAKHARAVAIVAALKQRRHRVIVTAHNISPHKSSDPVDAWFRTQILNLAEAMVVLVPEHEVALRKLGQVAPGTTVHSIPHPIEGHIDIEFERERTTLLVLGHIHPYHRILEFVDLLITAGCTRPVEVVGSVGDPELVVALEQRANDHEWLTIRAGYVSDEDLQPILARTAAVVSLQSVPFNSGAPYFALPRALPMILSEGAQAKGLQAEEGPEWVFQISADETRFDLAELESWLGRDRTRPKLERYLAETVAEQHLEMYQFHLRR